MKCDNDMDMDVHQATTVVSVVDAEGQTVLETIVETQEHHWIDPGSEPPTRTVVAAIGRVWRATTGGNGFKNNWII